MSTDHRAKVAAVEEFLEWAPSQDYHVYKTVDVEVPMGAGTHTRERVQKPVNPYEVLSAYAANLKTSSG